jgi:phosphoglycerate dehydrogenase-like enzyme
MMRLIVYRSALRRVEAHLAPYMDQLDLLVVDREGRITRGGDVVSDEDAQPDCGWVSPEGAFGPGGRPLLVALLKSHRLDWVHTGAAGVDDPVWGRLAAKGALLTTGHGQAISIAEFVVGEVLAWRQRVVERRAEQAARRWTRLPFREIAGSRWLIVGFGAIGQAVAQRAAAFGAEITGVRRAAEPHPLAARTVRLAEVRAHLPDADVVVLCAPLNKATRGLADSAFFAAMKPGSALVNVGRGDLLDEAALLAALGRGAPEHAILDVFHTEPLPQDSALWDHPRVWLAAHASAFGSGQSARNDALFLENLRRRLAGEPLLYPADPRDLGK